MFHCNFTYSLLGIETERTYVWMLLSNKNCNFTYSLLGIETYGFDQLEEFTQELQFHLLPIRDWNRIIG